MLRWSEAQTDKKTHWLYVWDYDGKSMRGSSATAPVSPSAVLSLCLHLQVTKSCEDLITKFKYNLWAAGVIDFHWNISNMMQLQSKAWNSQHTVQN